MWKQFKTGCKQNKIVMEWVQKKLSSSGWLDCLIYCIPNQKMMIVMWDLVVQFEVLCACINVVICGCKSFSTILITCRSGLTFTKTKFLNYHSRMESCGPVMTSWIFVLFFPLIEELYPPVCFSVLISLQARGFRLRDCMLYISTSCTPQTLVEIVIFSIILTEWELSVNRLDLKPPP